MPPILVVDDLAIFREPIEAFLTAQGFDVLTACDGMQALAAITENRPMLILLDLGLPVKDGLEVLRHLRANPAFKSTPVIILSAESDRAKITEAAKLGIAGYILKSNFSLKDLLTKVTAHISPGPTAKPKAAAGAPISKTPAASPAKPVPPLAPRAPASTGVARPIAALAPTLDVKTLKPLFTRTDLLERLKSCEELKGFSPTVSQVLQLTANDNSSLDAIARAISQDQAMALKILKVANSSIYSRGDRVDTVQKAVLRIGMASIRQAVLNIGVVERFSSPAFKDHISTEQFWEHSIACGIIAAEIAHAAGSKDADSAFTAGLLHDLGRVIFAEALGEDYIKVIRSARDAQLPLELVETRMLAMNHADVMDRLLSAWKFPKHLVEPILCHHLSAGNVRSVSPTRAPDSLRLGLADRLAHALLLGTAGNDTIYPTEEHCRALNISDSLIRHIEDKAPQHTDETKFSLICSAHSETWPRQADQVRATLPPNFRPLFVSAAPEIDAFRIFCNVLAGAPSDEPTILIAHIASAKDRDSVAQLIERAEEQAKVSNLPALILSPAGQLTLPEATLRNRAQVLVATPTPISRFVTAAFVLLSSAQSKLAA